MSLDFAPPDKYLHDPWLYGTGVAADGAAVRFDLAPTEYAATDAGQFLVKHCDARFTTSSILG